MGVRVYFRFGKSEEMLTVLSSDLFPGKQEAVCSQTLVCASDSEFGFRIPNFQSSDAMDDQRSAVAKLEAPSHSYENSGCAAFCQRDFLRPGYAWSFPFIHPLSSNLRSAVKNPASGNPTTLK